MAKAILILDEMPECCEKKMNEFIDLLCKFGFVKEEY